MKAKGAVAVEALASVARKVAVVMGTAGVVQVEVKSPLPSLSRLLMLVAPKYIWTCSLGGQLVPEQVNLVPGLPEAGLADKVGA